MSTQEALAPLAEPTLRLALVTSEPVPYRCNCGCSRCSPGVPGGVEDLAARLGHNDPEARAHDTWIWSGIGRRG
jgi:hypothetical protein